jgi:hypothetical protein
MLVRQYYAVGTSISNWSIALGLWRGELATSTGPSPSGPRGVRHSNHLGFNRGRCARPASSRREAGSALVRVLSYRRQRSKGGIGQRSTLCDNCTEAGIRRSQTRTVPDGSASQNARHAAIARRSQGPRRVHCEPREIGLPPTSCHIDADAAALRCCTSENNDVNQRAGRRCYSPRAYCRSFCLHRGHIRQQRVDHYGTKLKLWHL